MQQRVARIGCMLILSFFMVSAVSAQEAFVGKWKGEAVDPDGQLYPFAFEVPTADSTNVFGSVEGPGMEGVGPVPFNDFSMDGDTIKFWVRTQERFDCSVAPNEEGSYVGTCVNYEGARVDITMERVE